MAKQRTRRNRPKSPNPKSRQPAPAYAASNSTALFGIPVRNSVLTFIGIAVLAVTFMVLYSSIFDMKVDLNGDNLNYYYLAKNIKERGTYALYFDTAQTPHSHFPPGYPFIISIFMHISDSVRFVKLLNGFFLLASSILLFLTFRKFSVSIFMAFASAFALLPNGVYLKFSTIMMSEVPFLFLSTLSIYLISRSDLSKPVYKNTPFILSIAALYVAYLTRSQGIALLPGFLLFFFMKKKWSYIPASIGLFALFSVPWSIRNAAAGVSSGYVGQLLSKNPYKPELGPIDILGLLERVVSNAQRYLDKEIPKSLINSLQVTYSGDDFQRWTYWWIGAIALAFVVTGIISIRKNRPLLIGYLGGTLGILLLWPEVWTGPRFIAPVLPFLIFALLQGVKTLFDFLLEKVVQSKIRFNALLFIPFIILLNNQGIKELQAAAQEKEYYQNFQRFFELAASVQNENLNGQLTVASRKPEFFYHFSQTPSVSFLRTNNEEDLLNHLRENKVDLVVVDQLGFKDTHRYLVPAIENNPQHFQYIRKTETPETFLFRFIP